VPGRRYYVRANYLAAVSDDVIDVLAERYRQVPSPLSLIIVYSLGGAAGRVSAQATAFPHREGVSYLEVFTAWTDPADDDDNLAWLRDTWDAVQPFLDHGVYVNHLDRGEGENRVQEAYGPTTHGRLAALKAIYDPTNLFRLNQNVQPALGNISPT
jgi:FAD/FMN-containing dehydrogenase